MKDIFGQLIMKLLQPGESDQDSYDMRTQMKNQLANIKYFADVTDRAALPQIMIDWFQIEFKLTN